MLETLDEVQPSQSGPSPTGEPRWCLKLGHGEQARRLHVRPKILYSMNYMTIMTILGISRIE